MKDDLADVLIPVFWARDHIPVLQERLLNWQRRGHGISAPIDRLTFLTGRTTLEEPCPPRAKVTRSNRVGRAIFF